MDSMSTLKTIELELRKVAAMHAISGELLEQIRLTEDYEPMLNRMVYMLRAYVWTENLPPVQVNDTRTFTVEIPATWWQHAKQQHSGTWWMGWLARRRPPRLRKVTAQATLTVDLRRFRAYPDAPKLPASYGRHTALCEISQDVRWITGEGGYGS